MNPPYYVAVYGGFLAVEAYDTPAGERIKVFTEQNVRLASPFDTFAKADAAAKWAVGHLYPPDLRYFALLTVARE